jgi:hypothetical protein
VKHSLKTAETDTVRALMIQRGISIQCLAVACGVTARTMANQIAASFPSRRLRCIVENYFGVAIWATSEEFAKRRRVISAAGFNPFIQDVPAIQRHVTALKIPGRANRLRENLISLIEKHFADTTRNQEK